jgi:hypothetical protein
MPRSSPTPTLPPNNHQNIIIKLPRSCACMQHSPPHLADPRVHRQVGEVDSERCQVEDGIARLALPALDALDRLNLAQALGGGGDGCSSTYCALCVKEGSDVQEERHRECLDVVHEPAPFPAPPCPPKMQPRHAPSGGGGWMAFLRKSAGSPSSRATIVRDSSSCVVGYVVGAMQCNGLSKSCLSSIVWIAFV